MRDEQSDAVVNAHLTFLHQMILEECGEAFWLAQTVSQTDPENCRKLLPLLLTESLQEQYELEGRRHTND